MVPICVGLNRVADKPAAFHDLFRAGIGQSGAILRPDRPTLGAAVGIRGINPRIPCWTSLSNRAVLYQIQDGRDYDARDG